MFVHQSSGIVVDVDVFKYIKTFPSHFHFQYITDINKCRSSPCLHGNCTDHVNNYTCECQPGFIGDNCDTGLFILLIMIVCLHLRCPRI